MTLFLGIYQTVKNKITYNLIKHIDYSNYNELKLQNKPILQLLLRTIIVLSICTTILILIYYTALNAIVLLSFSITLFLFPYLTKKISTTIYLSNNFIEYNALLTRQKEIRWTEIKEIIFNKERRIQIYTNDEIIVIPYRLQNSIIFLRMMYDLVEEDKYITSLQNNDYVKTLMSKILKQTESESFHQLLNKRG